MKVGVIIVTYNSEAHIGKAIQCVLAQTHSVANVVLVDTGSKDLTYLNDFKDYPEIQVVYAEPNAGFCKGNNIGLKHLPVDCDCIFFLNPDAFINNNFVKIAVEELRKNPAIGALTGQTFGYDIRTDEPTGRYDTTGVFHTWYGRWFDRDQGVAVEKPRPHEFIPAICGAVFFCRKQALDSVLLREGEAFDNTFYMYKEDVDLSIRLRKKGWALAFVPQLKAYHCRGWNPQRSLMPKYFRMLSARNEIRVNLRSRHPLGVLYSSLKQLAVLVLDL